MSIFAIHREMVDCNQQPLLRDVHVHVYIYIERERDLYSLDRQSFVVPIDPRNSIRPRKNVYSSRATPLILFLTDSFFFSEFFFF